MVLTIRRCSGAIKGHRPRQGLYLGLGQGVPEFLTVRRRAGPLYRIDGSLESLIAVDRIDGRFLGKTLVVSDDLLHLGISARQVEGDRPVDGPFDAAIGQIPVG